MGQTILARIDQTQCEHYSSSELASYTDGVLTIPVLVFDEKAFRLTLNHVDARNFEFKLNGIEELADSSLATTDSFVSNELTIAGLYVNGTKYQTKLTLSNANELLFRLTDIQ